MTTRPTRTRLPRRRSHLARWVAAIALLMVMAACTEGPVPDPKVSFPATPTGSAIESVVDVPLGDVKVALSIGSAIAVDDITGDLFFLGREHVPPKDLRWTLSRVDRRSGAHTVLASLPGSSPYSMDHLVATNGWVFWVEFDSESQRASGQQRLVYLAIRANGTQRRVLASYQAPIGSAMGEPSPNSGFEAGGGTAMWLETREGERTLHLFDTRTAKTMLVKNQPKVRQLGSVHGDRVVLLAERGVQLYSIGTGQFSHIDYMWDGLASGVMLVGWVPSLPQQLSACFFTSPADPVECDKGVAAETAVRFWPRCVLGTYVAGYPDPDLDVAELINLAAPRDRMPISVSRGLFFCGGNSLVYSFRVQVQGSYFLETRHYIRVITVE